MPAVAGATVSELPGEVPEQGGAAAAHADCPPLHPHPAGLPRLAHRAVLPTLLSALQAAVPPPPQIQVKHLIRFAASNCS